MTCQKNKKKKKQYEIVDIDHHHNNCYYLLYIFAPDFFFFSYFCFSGGAFVYTKMVQNSELILVLLRIEFWRTTRAYSILIIHPFTHSDIPLSI